jgi:hypothetical protein
MIRYEVQGRKWRSWAKLYEADSYTVALSEYREYVRKMAANKSPYVDMRVIEVLITTEVR